MLFEQLVTNPKILNLPENLPADEFGTIIKLADMKKKFILILILIFFTPLIAFCETDEFDAGYDVFTKSRNLKPVSEQEVQQVLKMLEEKKKKRAEKKHWWQKDKKTKKIEGTALTKEGNNNGNDNVVQKPYLLIQVTDKLLGKNTIISPGFYTVVFNKDTDTLVLKQGYSPVGEIKMMPTPTEPDFEELYYIKTKRENENIRFLYGEVDKHYEGFCRILN